MSLADQLLKAGLVDKKKVNQAQKQRNKQQKQQRKTKQVITDEVKDSAQQARLQKAEQDRLLNQQRTQEAEHKALQAQIKQIIEMNKLPQDSDGVVYNFAHEKWVKRIYLASDLHKALVNGQLAIVSIDSEHYEVVPRIAAEKIAQRDPSKVILINDKPAQSEDAEDDPYADYEIPDDLMW